MMFVEISFQNVGLQGVQLQLRSYEQHRGNRHRVRGLQLKEISKTTKSNKKHDFRSNFIQNRIDIVRNQF